MTGPGHDPGTGKSPVQSPGHVPGHFLRPVVSRSFSKAGRVPVMSRSCPGTVPVLSRTGTVQCDRNGRITVIKACNFS